MSGEKTLGNRGRGSAVRKLAAAMDMVEYAIPATVLFVITLMLGYGVVARYVQGSSVAYINELAVMLACWLAFLGAAYGMRIRYHVAIGLLVTRLSSRGQALVDLVVSAVMCVGLGLLAYLGAEYTLESGARLQTLDMPRQPLIAAMPVGFALMTLHMLVRTVQSAIHLRTGDYQIKTSIEVAIDSSSSIDSIEDAAMFEQGDRR